jgi:hexosaminidase
MPMRWIMLTICLAAAVMAVSCAHRQESAVTNGEPSPPQPEAPVKVPLPPPPAEDVVLVPAPRTLSVSNVFYRPAFSNPQLNTGPLLDESFDQWLRIAEEVLRGLGLEKTDIRIQRNFNRNTPGPGTPRRERVRVEGVNPEGPPLMLTFRVDPVQIIQEQGYLLEIDNDGIRITGHDVPGVFYGAMTLRQLVRQYENTCSLPCLFIEDWPDFPNRGVMLDISRDKVPRMETLYQLVDLFAELKYNQLQLYMEHTFAYPGHETVWKDASPMTADQIRALVAYCNYRYIEVVPNQNSFGHMGRWLQHEEYQHLGEMPQGGSDLCPIDPECIVFLRGLYDNLLPHFFNSDEFNVGCDETWSLGKGRSKDACEAKGKGRVYLDFLLQIQELVAAHGRKMQFWGDIIMRYPELIPELPADVIAMEWGYDANHPFRAHGEKFAESGIPFYVVPGTSSWNSLLGRTGNALENLRSAAVNGRANGAIGYLVTDWGDNGHWQTMPVSLLPFTQGAALSWCYSSNENLDLLRAADMHVFHDAAGVMARAAYDLGAAHRKTGFTPGNSTAYYYLLLHAVQGSIDKGPLKGVTESALEETIAGLDAGMAQIEKAEMDREDAALVQREFLVNARLARLACRIGLERLRAGGVATSGIPEGIRNVLAADLTDIIEEQRAVWLARNREGGLGDSLEGLKRLREILER